MATGYCAKCRSSRDFESVRDARGHPAPPRCTTCSSRLFLLSEPAVRSATHFWCAKCRTKRTGEELERGRCAVCGSRVFALSD